MLLIESNIRFGNYKKYSKHEYQRDIRITLTEGIEDYCLAISVDRRPFMNSLFSLNDMEKAIEATCKSIIYWKNLGKDSFKTFIIGAR